LKSLCRRQNRSRRRTIPGGSAHDGGDLRQPEIEDARSRLGKVALQAKGELFDQAPTTDRDRGRPAANGTKSETNPCGSNNLMLRYLDSVKVEPRMPIPIRQSKSNALQAGTRFADGASHRPRASRAGRRPRLDGPPRSLVCASWSAPFDHLRTGLRDTRLCAPPQGDGSLGVNGEAKSWPTH
jgi:hypothetical protein